MANKPTTVILSTVKDDEWKSLVPFIDNRNSFSHRRFRRYKIVVAATVSECVVQYLPSLFLQKGWLSHTVAYVGSVIGSTVLQKTVSFLRFGLVSLNGV